MNNRCVASNIYSSRSVLIMGKAVSHFKYRRVDVGAKVFHGIGGSRLRGALLREWKKYAMCLEKIERYTD
jgi:hypothetical protein